MSDGDEQPSLKSLDERLRAARERAEAVHGKRLPSHGPRWASSFGFRVGVELVVALVVGGAIGWLLDYWFGTLPLFLIVFFVLGSVAGVLNVWRAAKEAMRRSQSEQQGE